MPWFSYHGGHSGEFCRHAKGSLEAVVERAIEAGFTHYGLSEHVARYREVDLFPGEEDLGPSGLLTLFERYTEHARALRDRYADRIELIIGFETERLPPEDWASRMREIRERAGFEYYVGSVHDVDGDVIDFSADKTAEVAEKVGGRDALHRRYFEAVAEVVTTLRPEVVGHLDLIRKFDGPAPSFSASTWPFIERALEAVRAVGGALDVNCGAHRRGLSPVYPLPSILKRAQQMGVAVTLGDDGHGAHDVGVGLDASLRAIADAGYREVTYLTRRDGVVQKASAPLEEVRPRV